MRQHGHSLKCQHWRIGSGYLSVVCNYSFPLAPRAEQREAVKPCNSRYDLCLCLALANGAKQESLVVYFHTSLLMFYYFQTGFLKRPPACFLLPPPLTFAAQKVVKSSFKSELLIVLFIIYIYILYLTCYIHVVRE